MLDERTYEFLTPVFGGGVRIDGAHKYADPVTPVRGMSIRGQLRFWWRAVNPSRCADESALSTQEARVFGTASGGERDVLDVCVLSQPASRAELKVLVQGDKFKVEKGMEAIAYGAFPLRDSENAQHGVLHEHRGAWRVAFRYGEELRDDVEAALWAWAHFGGLGGRTRRGFGAIRQSAGALPSIEEGWERWLRHPQRPPSVNWPALQADRESSLVKAVGTFDSGLMAQDHLLKALRLLRQGRLGRRPTSTRDERRPGRSYWPEADAIRAVTGQSAPDHRTRVTHVDAFPRAAFGMPIVFHFKDDRQGDPRDTQLKPVRGEKTLGRLASPLVLRPHAGAGGVEALALVLSHPKPDGHALDGAGSRGKGIRTTISHDEARDLTPLKAPNRDPFTDPLQRYLHLLRTGQ